ncbi:chemotaxis protein CheW [Psychrobacter pygoscelis]|uniref:chemotaxis protein CheW n=1 Tax=Psychrobacter pygoscelis TaxID=2488563 RepID=UPI0010401CD4|nr:chemotaxis protein CheW [Psychrobacter pygoscelis]
MASKGFIELLRLADLAKARQSGRHSLQQAQWLGVVFEVAGQRLVAPMGEVSEVLSLPNLTTVPLTQPWMLGVANVRGRLLPLTDLAKFLSLASQQRRQSLKKVLVIDQPSFFSGLLVDSVLGIQQFSQSQYQAEPMPSDSPFVRYNHGKFVKDGEDWFIFMPSLLAQDQRYIDAAL